MTLGTISVNGQDQPSALASINALRDDDELPPVVASRELDDLASRYVESMLAMRCICPTGNSGNPAEQLIDAIRTSIGEDAGQIDAGLIVGYDQNAAAAITTVVHNPANEAAILGTRIQMVGVATGTVPAGDRWLEPPPGDVGPDIELAGYSLVVIVVAGIAGIAD